MSYIKHRVGDIINGIKFLSLAGIKCKRRQGNFECPNCGRIWTTYVGHISGGHSKNCGCEREKKFLQRITKHGHCKGGMVTSEYTSYGEMMDRCCNPKNDYYHLYGGRGIYVCDRWKQSFTNFLEDMGLKPGKGYSIERVNNNGIYELSNCKWADAFEQANNMRTNVLLTYQGKTQTRAQWARELGIEETTIRGRQRRNLPIEQILSTHKDFYPSNSLFVTYEGVKVRLKDLCDRLGKDLTLVRVRMRKYGYTLEDALSKPLMAGNTKRHQVQ